jgi:hypothetical protein
MDSARIVVEYKSLPVSAQIEALVRFAYELTIVARDTYEPGSMALRFPERIRCLNELQHRIMSHLLALLTGDTHRYPDEVLVSILLEHDDAELGRMVAGAFGRSLSQPATVQA